MKKRKRPVSISRESRDTIKSIYIKRHPKFGAIALAELYGISCSAIFKIIKE